MTMKIVAFLCLLTVLNVQAMHIQETDVVSDDTRAYFKQLFSQADQTMELTEEDRDHDNVRPHPTPMTPVSMSGPPLDP